MTEQNCFLFVLLDKAVIGYKFYFITLYLKSNTYFFRMLARSPSPTLMLSVIALEQRQLPISVYACKKWVDAKDIHLSMLGKGLNSDSARIYHVLIVLFL